MSIVHIRKHDRYQLEIKTQSLTEGTKNTQSKIDLWLFLPPALGISPAEYTSHNFYSDLRTYTRLKTPRFSASQLLNQDDSPLCRLEAMLNASHDKQIQKVMRQEMKLLCSIVRKVSALQKQTASLEQMESILKRWRILFVQLSALSLSYKTTICLKIVDELMSNYWEVSLIEAQEMLVGEELEFINQSIEKEFQYRLEQEYYLYSSSKKEQYLFHFGNLVKFVSTVLFLDSRSDRFSDWLKHLALGTAAGLAMIWALFVQIYALVKYGVNLNEGMNIQLILTFVGIGIFSYILKDRIKATSGSWLASQISKYLPDRQRQYYLDDEEAAIAKISEKASFVKVKHLPLDIRDKYQNFQEWNPYFLFGSDVLHYHRDIDVFSKLAKKQFPRFRGVVDIHRFHVWNWIKTLAPPKKEIVVLTSKGKVERCKAPRVYTVNLLTKTQINSKIEYQLFRVLLNNRGLVEVEEVDFNPSSEMYKQSSK